jgi:predicted transcriptional regulator of viral defense system
MIRSPQNFLESHLDTLRAQGRHTFTLSELQKQFDISDQALTKALQRIKQKKKAISLRKGFYIITPIPAPNLFIPDLMNFLNRNFYTGLLSAAAHHTLIQETPNEYYIITKKPVLLPIRTDQLNINFYNKKKWDQDDIVDNISSPELTALDLVYYAPRLGGFDRITAVLDDLTELMDAETLVATAKNYAWDIFYMRSYTWRHSRNPSSITSKQQNTIPSYFTRKKKSRKTWFPATSGE